MRESGALAKFDRLQAAWSTWVYSLSKAEALSTEVVVCIRSKGGDEKAMWVLLADIVFNPRVQTLLVCRPVGAVVDEEGFYRASVPFPPYELEVLTAKSRLSRYGQTEYPTLWHLSSDELLRALSRDDDPDWEVAPLVYKVSCGSASLRFMQVASHNEAVAISTRKKARIANDDAFLAWLRLSEGRPSRSRGSAGRGGQSTPRAGQQRHSAPGSSNQGAAALEDEPGAPPERDLSDDSEPEVDLVNDDLALEELLQEVLDEAAAEDLDADIADAQVLGAADPPMNEEPASSSIEGAGALPKEEAPGPDEDAMAVVHTVSMALAGSAASGQAQSSGSSDLPPAPEEPGEIVGPGYIMSDLGYVRCSRPGHDINKSVGLVGWKRDKKSMYANCHLHSTCSISVGVMRRPVAREYLAEWLCKGQRPPDGASIEERKRLGVEHRKLWVRP